MPRWKALPEELDPQISEFTSQLRRLVDRSGMGLATIADRTGYSKSSWEKYLNGRLLPPRGAVQALSEVTGTEIRHLATMWELAERAWSRSEMRHDMTMEAVLVAQARAALAPSGETPAKGWKWNRAGKSAKGRTDEAAAGSENASAKGGVTEPPKPTPQPDPARRGASGGSGPAADDRTVSLHWREDRAADDSKTTQLSRNAVFGEADARRGRNLSAGAGGKSAGAPTASPAAAPSGPAAQDPSGKPGASGRPAAPAEAKASAASIAPDTRPKEGQDSGLPVSQLPPGAAAGTVDPRSWGVRDSPARPGAGSVEAGTAVLGKAAGGEVSPAQAGPGQGFAQAGPAPAVDAP
ncbi:helix-turn-helix domain-containing protein, partial [Streptomyces oceani]|uniref:helix-turn-helix domain-containing protein n=1 Tax=Streptomyces oceani TaxID=1075402 RepID=UPI001FCD5167